MTDALPASLSVHLDAYAEHLRLSRGRSEHTIRAYVGDARALLTHFSAGSENADLDRLDLSVMRSWLAAQNAVGTARTTVARRASSARGFTAWLAQTGRISVDPGTR
ncbi:site-specific integrase, partial [Rhodococcus erythropolis]|nr:site-specific integrase [Rhodococcus erythropolis]